MNKYREKFNNQKESVLKLLEGAKEYYEKYDNNNQVILFNEIIKNVNEDEFSIVLIGEFSAGKSTFLNALMGEKLLPSFTNETTATINYLRHKDKAENGEEGRVYFNDGTVKVLDKVDFETINKYVSANSEIGVVNKVDHLDLFLDSKFLKGNITLVDSPGLNGVADGHREVTESQIEKSSASIFMFKSNQPGSETDFKFLGELKNKVKTIIFVLNKIDDIKKSEGETPESVMEKLKENYKIKFPNETTIPEIWGISAYQALVARSKEHLDYRDRNDYTDEEKIALQEKSRMCEFENRLWQFITQGEKARAMLVSPIEKVISSLKETKNNIEEEVRILNGKEDSSEIDEKKIEVNNQINEINDSIKEVSTDIRSKLNLLISELQESIESNLEKIKQKQIKRLDTWKNLDDLIYFEQNIDKSVENEYKTVLNTCQKTFENKIRELIEENYSEIAEIINCNFNDSKFNININTKYESNQIEFELGIKKYEDQIKKLEENLEEKQKELEDSEKSAIKARVLKGKKEELTSQLASTKKLKKMYEDNQGPKKQFENKRTYEEEEIKGIKGVLKYIWKGKETISKDETKLVNQEDIDEFKKIKQNAIKDYTYEINELTKKLNSFNNDDMSEEEYDFIVEKISKEEKKIQDKIIKMQEEFNKKYIKKNERAFISKKNELIDYFDEINNEYLESLENESRHKKSLYFELIKSTISNKLTIKLEQKQEELHMLEAKLKSSIDEKNERIEKLNAMEEDINKIMIDAVSLQSDIEIEPINTIHQDLL